MPAHEFLLEDYRLKVQYLTDQFQRMWNRFQFLLSLETVLAGLFFAPLSGARAVSAPSFAVVGIAVSLFWYVVGAEDRFLVETYRAQVKDAAKDVAVDVKVEGYTYVGELEKLGRRHHIPLIGALNVAYKSPVEWRIEQISVTHLAAIFPLLMLAFWLVMLGTTIH